MADDRASSRTMGGGRVLVRWVREWTSILAAILVAFSLDAWWDARSEVGRTSDLLSVIEVEFGDAVAQLDSIVDQNDEFMRRATGIVARATQEPPPSSDSLALMIESLTLGYEIYDPEFGALTTLISTGGLERLSPELQDLLGGWFSRVSDLEFEMRGIEFATQMWFEAAAEAGVMSAYVTGVAAPQLASHRRPLADPLATLVFQLADYQRDLIRLRGAASEGISIIRASAF